MSPSTCTNFHKSIKPKEKLNKNLIFIYCNSIKIIANLNISRTQFKY